ncbi:hypothetical protein EPICR_50274 [Candidatus Desulfarcum epimagneticum]|uniref:Uncharacterized protein n=1 Tax=uncultured Desulfobacteraceae bacterium TaxID=218296 RepID=A0A484HNW7_9BACT|nr:hypothetical protein EPICR_50274 [uncultured Desulfobacteraceae bacterium]
MSREPLRGEKFPKARIGIWGAWSDMAVITLLTDFGLADEYAGVMKGHPGPLPRRRHRG